MIASLRRDMATGLDTALGEKLNADYWPSTALFWFISRCRVCPSAPSPSEQRLRQLPLEHTRRRRVCSDVGPSLPSQRMPCVPSEAPEHLPGPVPCQVTTSR